MVSRMTNFATPQIALPFAALGTQQMAFPGTGELNLASRRQLYPLGRHLLCLFLRHLLPSFLGPQKE